MSFLDLLDHSQRGAGRGAIAFKSALGELQQERLVPRDTPLHPLGSA